MYKKVIYALLPVCVMGLIFIASSQPYEQQDLRPAMNLYLPLDFLKPVLEPISVTYKGELISVATRGVDGMIEFFIRKAAHVTVFFLLMVTTYLAFEKNTSWRLQIKLFASFLITVIYAGFDEYHQSLTPNRTPYIGDVVLDSVGGLLGCALIAFLYWKGSVKFH
ncbi:VanZ family protein [Halobacillus litoralis]|uniref:VanZ family protein n=1 Tax=Halobacillus litoralis TaxID=45668 RepID=UPI0024925A09|nr:VanZ family protein [Halobacillus litoralis]